MPSIQLLTPPVPFKAISKFLSNKGTNLALPLSGTILSTVKLALANAKSPLIALLLLELL